jgi:glycolate oxidase iron-sulfur subunit
MSYHQPYDILMKYEDIIHRCYRCGLCRTVCPSFEEIGIESASPRGRIQLARALLTGDIQIDNAVQKRMLDCLNCMRCGEICPSGVRADWIVLALRAELAKRGKLNIIKKLVFNTIIRSPRLMSYIGRIASWGQKWFYHSNNLAEMLVPRCIGMGDKTFPRFTSRQAVKKWQSVVTPTSGKRVMRVGYFIGCATNLLFPEVGDATVRVLTHNHVEVVIPRGQVCCGIPVYTSGDFKTARYLATTNLRIFNKLDVDCIVTDCSSCSAALKHECHELLGVDQFHAPVYDLCDFLANVIEISRDFGEVPIKVTYHDPCHLKRGQGISKEPRDLMRMVPGVEIIEMEGADRCCGGAGTFSYTHHELSRSVGVHKAESIRSTYAEMVATPCPSCKMQIDDLICHHGLSAATIHPVQVLDMGYQKRAASATATIRENIFTI